MAAPEYVPVKPMEDVRAYTSPPRRPGAWMANRPGDLRGGQPIGPRFGTPGPDQGYALSLAHLFESRLVFQPGLGFEEAVAGCVGVALKRASLHGRAPVVHDLDVAFTMWGFLDTNPPAELLTLRKTAFDEVDDPHHYLERRAIADAARDSTLKMAHKDVPDAYKRDWRALLDLSALEPDQTA